MSNPMIFLLASSISIGGHVASVATTIVFTGAAAHRTDGATATTNNPRTKHTATVRLERLIDFPPSHNF
jgi:hypothetical protein